MSFHREVEYTLLYSICLFLGTVLVSIYAYFRYSYTYWARKKVPYLPPTFPLGNNEVFGPQAFSYGRESQEWYLTFKKMGVRFGGVWNFCNKALVLVDTELVKDVLTKDSSNFINRDFYHNPEQDPAANHLFVAEGQKWRYMRQKISPAFTSSKMKFMFESVNKCSEVLIQMIETARQSNNDIHLRLLLDNFTMDNIGVVAFGLEFNCLLSSDNKFRYIADLSVTPNLRQQTERLISRIAPKLAQKLGVTNLDRTLSNFFAEIVTENTDRRRKLNIRRNDFTQLLMDIQDASEKNGTRFDMDDILSNCIIFFLAGFDTSSKTMQFTLLELARNQELQEKTRHDISKVLIKYNNEHTYEGLQEMTYLRQAIDETLRLYPPVLTISRKSQQNYKLKGCDTVIEKGTPVVISVIGMHRDPELFPNPEKYDPDRFSPENKPNIVPYSYLPFGEGPRNCVGRRFGIMQAAIGLIRIISNYKIELSPKVKYPLEIKPGQFLLETDEVYVRAVKLK